jgi:hypothetical protein
MTRRARAPKTFPPRVGEGRPVSHEEPAQSRFSVCNRLETPLKDRLILPKKKEPKKKGLNTLVAAGRLVTRRARAKNLPIAMVARRGGRTVSHEEPAQSRFWVCNRLETPLKHRLILPKKEGT